MNDTQEFEIANYESPEISSSSSEDEQEELKKRPRIKWVYKQTFESAASAREWIDANQIWSLSKRSNCKVDDKEYFRCNRVPVRGQQCAAAVQLLYKGDSQNVLLFMTSKDHDHDDILVDNNKHGLNKATKKAIHLILENGVTQPRLIFDKLANEVENNPNCGIVMPQGLRQLYNFLQNRKGNFSVSNYI